MEIHDKVTNYEIGLSSEKPSLDKAEGIDRKQSQDVQNKEGTKAVDQDAIVSISRASKEAQLIKEILESEEGVREERVSDLKEKIESGRYTMNYEEVASKLVDTLLEDI